MLKPRFIEPCKVLKCIDPQALTLDLPPSLAKLHDAFHISLCTIIIMVDMYK